MGLVLLVKRGAIYLVDFGLKYQSELGKVRPALVIQSDMINKHLDEVEFKSVFVIPLTTDLKGGRFRKSISARDNLNRDSEVLINWACTIDLDRFKGNDILTTLDVDELREVKKKLDFFMGYMD